MSRISLALAVLAACATPVTLHADTYSFTIKTAQSTDMVPGTTFIAQGTLDGTPVSGSPNLLNLTGVSGMTPEYTFTGVAPIGSVSDIPYDNILNTDANARHVDSTGILLYLSSPVGISLAHVYDDNGYHVDVFDPNDPGDVTPFAIETFDVTPSTVPEPSTLALLGTGALGLVGIIRKRLA